MMTRTEIDAALTKDYQATVRAAKALRKDNDLQFLLSSASDLMLYMADPDGYRGDVKTLALACANFFGLFQSLHFLYGELEYDERTVSNQG